MKRCFYCGRELSGDKTLAEHLAYTHVAISKEPLLVQSPRVSYEYWRCFECWCGQRFIHRFDLMKHLDAVDVERHYYDGILDAISRVGGDG